MRKESFLRSVRRVSIWEGGGFNSVQYVSMWEGKEVFNKSYFV